MSLKQVKGKLSQINGLSLISPTRHGDHRGFFSQIYSKKKYLELGMNVTRAG